MSLLWSYLVGVFLYSVALYVSIFRDFKNHNPDLVLTLIVLWPISIPIMLGVIMYDERRNRLK